MKLNIHSVGTYRVSVAHSRPVKEARWGEQLPRRGISIDDVTRQREDEGVEKFNHPFGKLVGTLGKRHHGI